MSEPRKLAEAFDESVSRVKQMLESTDEKIRFKACAAAIKLIDATDKWDKWKPPVRLKGVKTGGAMKSILVLVLAAVAVPAVQGAGCANADFQICWDGCRASTCGFLGSGAVISFSMETPGAWYSSCSSTGGSCSWNPDDGHACQSKAIMLSYRDCQGNANAIAAEPCCEAGVWEAAPSQTASKALCRAVDSLLPIPVGVPR